MMVAVPDSKHKKTAIKPEKKTKTSTKKIKVGSQKKIPVPTKALSKNRLSSKGALLEIQQALRAAQAELQVEQLARIRTEKALNEVREILVATPSRIDQEEQAQIRRLSFIVRLMLDQHGQLQRSEIEQVNGDRKQSFLGLDGERLVSFMKICIPPKILAQDTIIAGHLPKKTTIPSQELPRPKCALVISRVHAFRLKESNFLTVMPTPEESFGLQVSFQLRGADAQFLSSQCLPFEIRVYAQKINSGKSKLLTSYFAQLIENVSEYVVPIETPGLSVGLYRLFIVITLQASTKLVSFHDKTIIHML